MSASSDSNSNFLPAFLISYSDSSFTNPHEVVLPDEPPECTGNFTHMGAKYWGYETGRHRAVTINDDEDSFTFDHSACHWLHIGLKQPAVIDRISISTKWFTGNQVPEISVELDDADERFEVIGRTSLAPDQDHEFSIPPTRADSCFIKCFHEGGIARINLFGETAEIKVKTNLLEAATISHVSNEHYGRPADAVAGNREVDYMFGWESARTGFGEQALFSLAEQSAVSEIIVDTYMHRLNPPLSCHVFALNETTTSNVDAHMSRRPRWTLEFTDGYRVQPDDFQQYMEQQQYLLEETEEPARFQIRLLNAAPDLWLPLISFGHLRPDTWHRFNELEYVGPTTHLLYMHYPNGGIHGLKVFGQPFNRQEQARQ